MPKPMQVTPESMQQQGASLTSTGSEMVNGLNGLLSTIQGDGYPWGGDEQGTLFAGLYQTVLTKAFESISSHVEQVQYAGAALDTQSQGYGGTETALQSRFSSMSGQING